LAIAKAMLASHSEEIAFPGTGKSGALSENTLLKVLQDRLGHQGVTVHGFRSTFRDWTAEQTNYAREVAEKSLGHAVSDAVEAAYRRGGAAREAQAVDGRVEQLLRTTNRHRSYRHADQEPGQLDPGQEVSHARPPDRRSRGMVRRQRPSLPRPPPVPRDRRVGRLRRAGDAPLLHHALDHLDERLRSPFDAALLDRLGAQRDLVVGELRAARRLDLFDPAVHFDLG
jgi:hypothetical protein